METVTSKDKKWLSSKDFSLTMLEIFSGCSLLSTCCKRLDNHMKSNATRKADFQSDYAQSFLVASIYRWFTQLILAWQVTHSEQEIITTRLTKSIESCYPVLEDARAVCKESTLYHYY